MGFTSGKSLSFVHTLQLKLQSGSSNSKEERILRHTNKWTADHNYFSRHYLLLSKTVVCLGFFHKTIILTYIFKVLTDDGFLRKLKHTACCGRYG
jgi:hypothetical protein